MKHYMTKELYIGLISGTSADGIDAVLVDFSQHQPRMIASHYAAYPPTLRAEILALYEQGENEIQRLGELDVSLGQAFAHPPPPPLFSRKKMGNNNFIAFKRVFLLVAVLFAKTMGVMRMMTNGL